MNVFNTILTQYHLDCYIYYTIQYRHPTNHKVCHRLNLTNYACKIND